MARWTDLATWVGPTPNQSGSMREQRGLVLHIMQGSLAGSVSWAKNPASMVSFHFGTSKAGACQQLVDTSITAWTQGSGNGYWISVENEDYSGNPLSAAQVEVVAQLYARGVRDYGWPYALANSPSGRGLGFHAMGGVAWGNHPDCPGQPIIDQRPAILARAQQINNSPSGSDMQQYVIARDNHTGQLYLCDGMTSRPVTDTDVINIRTLAGEGLFGLTNGGATRDGWGPGAFGPVATGGGGGTGGGATVAEIRAELDKTTIGSVPGTLGH
jgi:hypothetical protein